MKILGHEKFLKRHIIGENFVIMERNGFIHVGGDCNLTAEGNVNIYARTDANIQVEQNATIKVGANLDVGAANDIFLAAGGDILMKAIIVFLVKCSKISKKILIYSTIF